MISHHQFLKKMMAMRRRLKYPHTHTHKSLGFSQCVCLKCICMCMFYFKVSISSSSSSSSRHELLCPFCCLYTIFVIVILLAWPDDWLCWVLNYVISYFYLTQWVMFCVQDENVCVCAGQFFLLYLRGSTQCFEIVWIWGLYGSLSGTATKHPPTHQFLHDYHNISSVQWDDLDNNEGVIMAFDIFSQ